MPSARDIEEGLRHPIRFAPVYQPLVWGGRRMALYRDDLPRGDIGESWEISQQPRGISRVAEGPLAGMGLDELMATNGRALVGSSYSGGDFPLLIKLIDARDRLSVQVHPDDAIAQELGVGPRGKTECWYVVGDGGQLFQGTTPGTTREQFERAIREDTIADTLNSFTTKDGDFFFIPARTVHAIGANTMIWEIQQSCDVTFRVSDWGRVWDGKRRQLHVDESLATIDFTNREWGPVRSGFDEEPCGGDIRRLVSCPYFSVSERRGAQVEGGGNDSCSIIILIEGYARLATSVGEIELPPMSSALVSANAGGWSLSAEGRENLRALVTQPG